MAKGLLITAGLGLAAYLLTSRSPESKSPSTSEESPVKLDDRIQALISFLGSRARVIQTFRSPEEQARAIAAGASQWSGDPRKAPHPSGRAVDMQPAQDVPNWGDYEGWMTWAEEVKDAAKQLGLNPRWGGHWAGIQDGDIHQLLEHYRQWKLERGEKPFWDPVHWDFPEGDSGVYLEPNGYRRALQSEVTPQMMHEASASLTKPIGTFLIRDGYAIGLEHHFTTEKGRHKGASIFIPSALDVDSPAVS